MHTPCQGLFNHIKSKARALTFKEGYGAVTSKTNKQTNPSLNTKTFTIEMKEFNQNKASRAENNIFFKREGKLGNGS